MQCSVDDVHAYIPEAYTWRKSRPFWPSSASTGMSAMGTSCYQREPAEKKHMMRQWCSLWQMHTLWTPFGSLSHRWSIGWAWGQPVQKHEQRRRRRLGALHCCGHRGFACNMGSKEDIIQVDCIAVAIVLLSANRTYALGRCAWALQWQPLLLFLSMKACRRMMTRRQVSSYKSNRPRTQQAVPNACRCGKWFVKSTDASWNYPNAINTVLASSNENEVNHGIWCVVTCWQTTAWGKCLCIDVRH